MPLAEMAALFGLRAHAMDSAPSTPSCRMPMPRRQPKRVSSESGHEEAAVANLSRRHILPSPAHFQFGIDDGRERTAIAELSQVLLGSGMTELRRLQVEFHRLLSILRRFEVKRLAEIEHG